MNEFSNRVLIKRAASLINPRRTKDGLFADVGCVLLSQQNQIYHGVCAASGSNTFCAETAAIAAMITGGEYRLKKIVATWKDERELTFVISPCGNCRQLMRETHESNLEAKIILDEKKSVILKELLPYYDWCQEQL